MTTKKDKINHFKYLINNIGLCSSLILNNPNVYLEFMDLFKNHPEYPDKINDVVDISIIKNKITPKFFELQLIKNVKGEIITESISYRCCINKPNKDANLKSAMRTAIIPQILDFRNKVLLECEICKSNEDIQIDHIIQFQCLYNNFIKNRKDIPHIFDTDLCNRAIFNIKDKDFKNEWCEFHKDNAKLRCLCKKCNLTRKKRYKNITYAAGVAAGVAGAAAGGEGLSLRSL